MAKRARRAPLLVGVGLLAFGAFAAMGRAHAEDRTDAVRFAVEGSVTGCPKASAFDAKVRALLGEHGVPADTSVTVRVRRAGEELAADLEVHAHGALVGRRELRAPRRACADLASAAALAASLILEEEANRKAPEPATKPELAPEAPPGQDAEIAPRPVGSSASSPPSPPREQAPTIAASLDGASWVGGELAWRALPHPAAGLVAGFSVGKGPVLGFVEGAAFVPSEVESALGAVLRVGMHVVRAGPCLRATPLSRLVLTGCASGNLGSLSGTGTARIANAREYRFLLAEVGLRASVAVPLTGPFRVRLDVRGAVPLATSRFTLGDLSFETPPWSIALGIAGEAHF